MSPPVRDPRRFALRRWILAGTAVLVAATMLYGASAASVGGGAGHAIAATHSLHWQLVATSVAPAKRNWFGMAYDASDNYTVLYGGYDPSIPTFYYDTWVYSFGKWTELYPTNHPSAASGLKMVYDPMLNGVIAFGGESPYGGTYYNDTWLFHHGNWTQLFPTVSPSPRSQFAMAYDPADSEIVLFSGSTGGTGFSDTWTFNGTTWARVNSVTNPSGRLFANMAYDAKSGKVILGGGINYTTGSTNTTWTFSHGAWQRLSHAGFPGRVHTPIATLANGTPFFFGGQSSYSSNPLLYNTSYEFFGGKWHQVPVANAPSPRSNGGLVYDAFDGHLLMFGGGLNPVLWNQTYVLR